MNPMILSLLVGGLVIATVALLLMALRGGDEGKASERLDQLVGRNIRKDSSADLLLKQAMMEGAQRNFLDRITPEVFNLTKMVEQADANIKPSALVGIPPGPAGLGAALSVWAVHLL